MIGHKTVLKTFIVIKHEEMYGEQIIAFNKKYIPDENGIFTPNHQGLKQTVKVHQNKDKKSPQSSNSRQLNSTSLTESLCRNRVRKLRASTAARLRFFMSLTLHDYKYPASMTGIM